MALTFKDKIAVLELMIQALPTQDTASSGICWTLSDIVSRYFGIKPYHSISGSGDNLARYMYRVFPELYWALHLACLDRDICKRFEMMDDAEFIRTDRPTHLWDLPNPMDETMYRIEFLTNVKLMMIDHAKEVQD